MVYDKVRGGTLQVWRGAKGNVTIDEEGHTADGEIRDALLEAVEDYQSALAALVTSVDVLKQLSSQMSPVLPKLTEPSPSLSTKSSITPNSPASSTLTESMQLL